MKRMLINIVCLAMIATASAQQQKDSPSVKPPHKENASSASILEGKIRKAWEDYKKKDKEAFAAVVGYFEFPQA